MSKPRLFPAGHPFAGKLPVGVSPFELADQLIAYHSGRNPGCQMVKKDDDDDDDDDDDEEDESDLDPETIIKVDGKEFALKDLQRIMRKEKVQGKRSGSRETLKELGFDSLEDAKTAIAKVKKPAKKAADDDGDDDEADQRATQRETAAEARERKAAEKERKLDLRGALRDAGVSRDDLDDAHAILDREVDAEYDDDAIDDAVEELRGRRPGLFGDDDEDDDEKAKAKKKAPARGRIPTGRPGKKKVQAKSDWARGEEIAKRRHGITTD